MISALITSHHFDLKLFGYIVKWSDVNRYNASLPLKCNFDR
jgi:hypothetical protein